MDTDFQTALAQDISDKPKFPVFLSAERIIHWPAICSLCGSNFIGFTKEFSITYQSGEYIVGQAYSDAKVREIPYCKSCFERTTPSKVENLITIVGIIIGIIIGALIAIINFNYLLLGVIIGLATMLGISFIGIKIVGIKPESDSVDITVGTSTNFLGSRNPNWMKFLFRNKNYAYEFAKLNNALGPHICNRCNNPLLFNIASSNWYCLTCQ